MTFNISAVEGCHYPDGISRFEIEINGYLENGYLSTTLWTLDDYRRQWTVALSDLYAGKIKKCMLITEISKRSISNFIIFWALYAIVDEIVIRQIFIRSPDKVNWLESKDVEYLIHSRDNDDEDEEHKPSEWKIRFQDIAHLVKS